MKKLYVILLLLVFAACEQPKPKQTEKAGFSSKGKIDYQLSMDDENMLDSIQQKTFEFFLQEHHPEWGIVKDRTKEWAPASIASTGFGLACFAIGAERNYISREKAAQITLNNLKFFMNSEQSTDSISSGYKGFYYHFLRMDTGKREWNCELSSVDTGLLMMGILFARNYYNQDNKIEKQIRDLASKLLERVDWDFMEMPAGNKFAHSIAMGLVPRQGPASHGLDRIQ